MIDLIGAPAPQRELNTAAMVEKLQATMQDDVGALRDETKLKRALETINTMAAELGDQPQGDGHRFDMRRIDWFDLRNMLLVAKTVAQAALARTETRGAQHREDYPEISPDWACNQFIDLNDGDITLSRRAVPAQAAVIS